MVLSGKKRPLLLIPVIIILFTLWVHYTRITSSVRIGVSLNLSETADPTELHMEQGIELAADILNEKGGINGRRLEIMTLDNKGNEKGSEIAAENAALRHAAALIGPLDSKLLSPTAIVGETETCPSLLRHTSILICGRTLVQGSLTITCLPHPSPLRKKGVPWQPSPLKNYINPVY